MADNRRSNTNLDQQLKTDLKKLYLVIMATSLQSPREQLLQKVEAKLKTTPQKLRCLQRLQRKSCRSKIKNRGHLCSRLLML